MNTSNTHLVVFS